MSEEGRAPVASEREGWFQGMSERRAAMSWFTQPQTANAASPSKRSVAFMMLL